MDKAFVEKVANMRRLQKDYFRYRDHMTLQASKKAEREVDGLVSDYLGTDKPVQVSDNYPKLF